MASMFPFSSSSVTGGYLQSSSPVIKTEIDPVTGEPIERLLPSRTKLGSVAAGGREAVFLGYRTYTTQGSTAASAYDDFGGRGDVNCDGKIDVDDCRVLDIVYKTVQDVGPQTVGDAFNLRTSTDCYTPVASSMQRARYVTAGDVNFNGRIDPWDIDSLCRSVKSAGSERRREFLTGQWDCSAGDIGGQTCVSGMLCTCVEDFPGRYAHWECARCPAQSECVGGGHVVGGQRAAACETRTVY